MKKGLLIFIILICIFSANAQEKKKDTLVETEIVNIVTKYNPEIADVTKIKNNPKIELLKKSDKKKLVYTITSAPVVSTFIPKTGVLKGIKVGVKERIYDNYLAAGFGNYKSTYAALFINQDIGFDSEFGLHAKYNTSKENIENTVLNSNFLNFNIGTFFKQETRYFDWKIRADAERNNYNWYGLPTDKTFTQGTIDRIDEQQVYSYLKLVGDLQFYDSYLDFAEISASYFTDKFESSEILMNFETQLNLPLNFLRNRLDDLSMHTGVEFLQGTFKQSYDTSDEINYRQITLKLIPSYTLEYYGFSMKAGFKTFVSFDTENDSTNFLLFPDILMKTMLFKKYLSAYGGYTGNLETNTYKSFTEENPFASPTLFITQTAETANIFIGLKGNINKSLSYNIKASSIKEEDKPLFLRNNSKSDGTTTLFNAPVLQGYEYGNSFGIIYDDVQTNSIFAEVEYLFNKNLTFSTQVQFDNYTAENALENWNLPSLQAALLIKYKQDKWYATGNIFYVDERKDAFYSAAFPATLNGAQTLHSFVDVNLDGGYHFNDKFSTFLQLNNVLNTTYQRFANFDTQGFQVMAGLTYKFDF